MRASGLVQLSTCGTTYVAAPARVLSYLRQAKPGTVYVEFDVPGDRLYENNKEEGWSLVIGPGSAKAKALQRRGVNIVAMPEALNIAALFIKRPDGGYDPFEE